MSEKLVLGVEGGGTKSDWIFLRQSGTESIVVGKGKLPAANLRLVTDSTLEQIFRYLPAEATHVGVFLAGCITEQDRNRLQALCQSVWPHATLAVGSDRDSSLAAAFRDGDGIVVIGGTGSAVTGRKNGRLEKAGGRGHLLGDRGGAYVICIEGLRLALRVYDLNRRATPLAQNILRALSLNQIEDLIGWTQGADKMSIAALSPVMFAAAQNGDEKMLAIIRKGAVTLARYTASVARRLKFKAPPVKLLGGLFTHEPAYVQLYSDALARLLPDATVELSSDSGVMGAAWLASSFEKAKPASANGWRSGAAADLAQAATEQPNPRSANLDRLNAAELVEIFIQEEAYVNEALMACRHSLQKGVELIAEALRAGGRLFYVGAGTSGRLGVLDASEIPPTFGEAPERVQGIIAGGLPALHSSVEGAEDDEAQASLSVLERGVRAGDVVCGITASGRTPFVLAALRKAKEIGAKTILLSCNPSRNRFVIPDVDIDLPTGPELLTGSTRLKAGTATKVALNILSTASMILIGRVMGNWMIGMRATNTKLRNRAIRIVCRIKHCTVEEATVLLQQHGWNVRQALGRE